MLSIIALRLITDIEHASIKKYCEYITQGLKYLVYYYINIYKLCTCKNITSVVIII